MANTYNRQPMQIKAPDVDYKFFNHNQWKGASDNRNFLSVDHETFEDCNNVYMDEQGLLKSRPATKLYTAHGLENILRIWTFGNIQVYLTNDSSYHLSFVSDDKIDTVEIDSENIKLVLVEQKIYVFSSTSLHYYDISENVTNRWFDGSSKIYIPITKRYVNNVLSDTAFSENELTSSYITQYIYDNMHTASFSDFVGSKVIVKIDDTDYELTFQLNNEIVFLQRNTSLDASNFATNSILGLNANGLPLISVSELNTMIICSYIDNKYVIYYTTDGLTFERLPDLKNIVNCPKISHDGTYVAAFTTDGIYFYSLLATETTGENSEVIKKYPTWTNVLQDLNYQYKDYFYLEKDSIANGDFLSYDVFTFVMQCVTTEALQTDINKSEIDDHSLLSVICRRGIFQCTLLSGQYHYEFSQTNETAAAAINMQFNSTSFKTYVYGKDLCYPHIDGRFNMTSRNADVLDGRRFTIELKLAPQHSAGSSSYIFYYNKAIDLTNPVDNYYTYNDDCIRMIATLSGTTWTIDIDCYGLADDSSNAFYYTEKPNVALYHESDQSTAAITVNTHDITTSANSVKLFLITATDSNRYSSLQHVIPNDMQVFVPALKVGMLVRKNNCYLVHRGSSSYYATLHTYTFSSNLAELKHDVVSYGEYNYDYRNDIFVINSDNANQIASNHYIHDSSALIPTLIAAVPLKFTNDILVAATDTNIYKTTDKVELTVQTDGEIKYFVPDYFVELNDFYFAKDNNMYESQYPSDGEFKWYFPKSKTEIFESKITNIHPISKTEIAIFLDNAIYYASSTELYKSKLGVGLKDGSDVITTFDGKNIIFATPRGLVAMSYQDFIASTEQSLTYLSDTIFKRFFEFSKEPIKLYQYKFWIVCYTLTSKIAYVYDIRNSSWWPMSFDTTLQQIITIDKPCIVSNSKTYTTNALSKVYKDDYSDKNIEWHLTSQKLHLEAMNYKKRIVNMIISSLSDNDANMLLKVINYRRQAAESAQEILDYEIDVIRNFVKKLNYVSVDEFQYTLSNDSSNAIQTQLCLSNIAIKYTITGVMK